ncbi:YdcF family protein [Roseateles paludis]|uniref:YdcF family protein n=1 Tax=Roseateles paludis TaxID=3145238 RepID=A0ABV0G7P5_9BURK
MDFGLLKTLVLIVLLPPVSPMLVIVAAWCLRRRRGAGALFGLGLALLWFSATDAAGQWLTQQVLAPPPALRPADLPRGPKTAILVLGGGIRQHVPEYDAAGLQALTQERLNYGVWLARQTGDALAFSGGIGWAARDQTLSEAEVVSRVAKEQYGITLALAESTSRDTRENAQNTLPLLTRAGFQRVILVTHDLHMPRALRAFKNATGAESLEIIPAPLGMNDGNYSALTDWCPSDAGLHRVRYVMYEALARLTGR